MEVSLHIIKAMADPEFDVRGAPHRDRYEGVQGGAHAPPIIFFIRILFLLRAVHCMQKCLF